MEQTQNNAEALLRLEGPFSPKDVKWLVAATSRDGTKGRVTPYADPRAYTDRLNEVVTASGWTRQYAVHTISPVIRLKKDKAIQTGKVLVTCTVTIAGIGSHSGSGEEWADDENAMTSADPSMGTFSTSIGSSRACRHSWEIEAEGRSCVRIGRDLQMAAMRFDNCFTDGEAHPHTVFLRRKERFECSV